jgi:hypothetical protein
MNRLLAVLFFLSLLAACGAPAVPTPDLVALREQIVRDVLATLTAAAPTATRTPEPSNTPSPSPSPSPAPLATSTATWTPSALPAPTEPPPSATATSGPTATRAAARATRTSAPPPTSAPPAAARSGTLAFAGYEPAAGGYTLYTLTSAGKLSAIAHHVHHPDINPDGKVIAVAGTGAGREDLWALVPATGEWRQLTRYLEDHYPTWSANGQAIGFSSSRQGDGVYRLYVAEQPVRSDRSKWILGDYAILLTTGDMVYAGCDYGWGTGAHCGIFLASDGLRPRQLTDNPADVPTDANASDVLFLRPDGNDWDVYRVGTGGGAPVRLFAAPGRDGPAALSPDGKSVALLSDRSGAWALYTGSLRGGSLEKILDLPAGLDFDHAPYPWWSERLSWGPEPYRPALTPTPPGGALLPAPAITFPIPDDTVSTKRATLVQWTWSRQLGPNQAFEVRFWHPSESPAGVAAPTTATQLDVQFGLTDAYRRYGDVFYYLDVVVVTLQPYRVISEGAPIRVKADPNK